MSTSNQIRLDPEDVPKVEEHVQQSDEYRSAPVISDTGIEAYLVEDKEQGLVHYVEKGDEGITSDGRISFNYASVEGTIEEVAEELNGVEESDGVGAMYLAAERAEGHPMRDPEPSDQEIIEGDENFAYTGWGWSDSVQESDKL